MTVASPRIEIFTRDELCRQPWLSALAEMINGSYREHATSSVGCNGERLDSSIQILQEIGPTGFTAVAFAPAAAEPVHDRYDDQTGREIVGTISVKDWASGGLWMPAGTFGDAADVQEGAAALAQALALPRDRQVRCDGDLEIALVAVKRDARWRKRGIAEQLLRRCEGEILRRLAETPPTATATPTPTAEGEADAVPVRLMVKVVRELNGAYWTKKGFQTVGEKWCSRGTWDSVTAFVLTAMARDLIN